MRFYRLIRGLLCGYHVCAFLFLLFFVFALMLSKEAFSEENKYTGKKILYVNSYHPGYLWSDGEQAGAMKILSRSGVTVKVLYMDTKRNTSEEFCKTAGLNVKKEIETFKPDVLITADDNAFIYVVKDHYRDAELPVVFCGFNWDISIVGGPYKNTTGMLEVGLSSQLYEHMQKFSKGDRLGLLVYDAPHERRNIEYFQKYVSKKPLEVALVKDFESWKKEFKLLQKRSDMIILASPEGIKDWNTQEAEKFVHENIEIPTGSDMMNVIPCCLIGIMKSAEEQGEYAANVALRILDGERPCDIPLVENKKGDLLLNLKLASKLNIVFNPYFLKSAHKFVGIDP
jgi:ABC-type uncharacterized transport system substrate-binding protein